MLAGDAGHPRRAMVNGSHGHYDRQPLTGSPPKPGIFGMFRDGRRVPANVAIAWKSAAFHPFCRSATLDLKPVQIPSGTLDLTAEFRRKPSTLLGVDGFARRSELELAHELQVDTLR